MNSDSKSEEKQQSPRLAMRLYRSMKDIPRQDWDCCHDTDYPTMSYGYLSSLEDSGCVGAAVGLNPRHLVISNADTGEICGVMPGYIKSNSRGELNIDSSWAKYYRGPTKAYYPKYQSEVPFTPVTAPNFQINPAYQEQISLSSIFDNLCRVASENSLSSFHINYISGEQAAAIKGPGIIHQTHMQFHWMNNGYRDFDDFLGQLTNKYRAKIKFERKRLQTEGLEYLNVEGVNITSAQMDFMFDVYVKTNDDYKGSAYLNRQFFDLLLQRIPHNIVLFLALQDGKPIAGAFILKSDNRIFSRYWGCTKFVKFLHFEMSYYRVMEYAIDHGIGYFDGGASGLHKKERAMKPVDIHHLHWVNDPGFLQRAQRHLNASKASWRNLKIEHGGKNIYRKTDDNKS